MNPRVDFFFNKESRWQEAYEQLRMIVLDCGLNEELKWGQPCYQFGDRNIVLIHGFKEYCALLFFKGALMPDPKGILVQQTENVQSARQVRFSSVQEIKKMKSILKTYIMNAIEVEKAGLKVKLKKTTAFKMPEEFRAKLQKSAKLKTAFESLTPGRQRAYLLYFAGAKQSATRMARIEKYREHILKGKGLNDTTD